MLARTAARRALSSRLAAPSRRPLSTAATPKKRSWKGAAFRWGLAGAGLYYYNTNDFFGEQEQAAIDRLEESIHSIQQSELPTIEAIVAEKHARAAARAAEEVRKAEAELAVIAAAKAAAEAEPLLEVADEETGAAAGLDADEQAEGGSIEDLEAEAGQQGAFNPETGEINWDCPCLGGMAHGPCGPEFRDAFSCFVYSKEEPKGMECIDKFKGMQDCFRAHPDMYGSELEDEEDEIEAEINAQEAAKAAERGDVVTETAASARAEESFGRSSEPKEGDGSGELVPKATLDAAAPAANEEK